MQTESRPETFPKVPLVLEGLSSRFIRENRIVPLELKNNVLKVLMADPGEGEVIEALAAALDADVRAYPGDGKLIDYYISRYYGQETQDINEIIEDIDDRGFELTDGEGEDIGHRVGSDGRRGFAQGRVRGFTKKGVYTIRIQWKGRLSDNGCLSDICFKEGKGRKEWDRKACRFPTNAARP